MRPGQLVFPALAALLFLLSGLSLTTGCNKALCASDVSKCLIQVRRSLAVKLLFSVKPAANLSLRAMDNEYQIYITIVNIHQPGHTDFPFLTIDLYIAFVMWLLIHYHMR